jgi:hypothetical protein
MATYKCKKKGIVFRDIAPDKLKLEIYTECYRVCGLRGILDCIAGNVEEVDDGTERLNADADRTGTTTA